VCAAGVGGRGGGQRRIAASVRRTVQRLAVHTASHRVHSRSAEQPCSRTRRSIQEAAAPLASKNRSQFTSLAACKWPPAAVSPLAPHEHEQECIHQDRYLARYLWHSARRALWRMTRVPRARLHYTIRAHGVHSIGQSRIASVENLLASLRPHDGPKTPAISRR
jgi:hypothetical protein